MWLQASPEKLAVRVGDAQSRPLLQGDPAGALGRLDALRRPAYEAAAHEIIDADGVSIAVVVDAVLAKFASTERVSVQPRTAAEPMPRRAKTRP